MHLPHKQSDIISNCAARLAELTTELLAELSPAGPAESFGANPDLLRDRPGDTVWLLESGTAFFRVGAKQVVSFTPGDLFGLEPMDSAERGAYGSSEPVTLVPYRRADLLSGSASRLIDYLLCANGFYRNALAQEIRADFQPSAGFMHFRAGETIIHQGADADRVYTLLEGQAEAMRDGVKVGDIHANEIFGALAVFTRQKRIASVVAVSDCTVLAVRKEEFADLAELQPQICMSLIEELADKIHHLNGQVLAMQAKG